MIGALLLLPPLAQSAPATLSVLLFYRHAKDTFTPGPLHLLVSPTRIILPQIVTVSLTFFESQLLPEHFL